jgi:hypothetical protein
MAKNRKYQSASIRFAPVLKAVLLCLLIGGSGVGYVWQKSQIYELSKQMKARESRLGDLREENKKLSDQLAMLRAPGRLAERVRELNLGLVPPRPASVVRLLEPAGAARPEGAASMMARSEGGPR